MAKSSKNKRKNKNRIEESSSPGSVSAVNPLFGDDLAGGDARPASSSSRAKNPLFQEDLAGASLTSSKNKKTSPAQYSFHQNDLAGGGDAPTAASRHAKNHLFQEDIAGASKMTSPAQDALLQGDLAGGDALPTPASSRRAKNHLFQEDIAGASPATSKNTSPAQDALLQNDLVGSDMPPASSRCCGKNLLPFEEGITGASPVASKKTSPAQNHQLQNNLVGGDMSPAISKNSRAQNYLLLDDLAGVSPVTSCRPPQYHIAGGGNAAPASSSQAHDNGWQTVTYKSRGRQSPYKPLVHDARPKLVYSVLRFRKLAAPVPLVQYPLLAKPKQKQPEQVAVEEDMPYIGGLFDDNDEVDQEEEQHALYLRHSSECKKGILVCLIYFLELGEPTTVKKNEVEDHCKSVHNTSGIKCEQKGCMVRGKTKGDIGKHKLYCHDLRTRQR